MTTTIKYPLSRAHSALTIIHQLLPHWETNQQLTETSDGTHTRGTPNPDTLPFKLDHTLDTDQRTNTRAGALRVLNNIYTSWAPTTGHYTHHTRPSSRSLVATLLTLAPSAYSTLSARLWNHTTDTLEDLARDAYTHTGHAPKTLPYPCLNCHSPLEQPYTDTGLLDIYVCPSCQAWWTPPTYLATVTAYARLGRLDCHLTMQQAANLLNLPLGTLHARIKRAHLTPVSGHGRHARYRLSDIKTS